MFPLIVAVLTVLIFLDSFPPRQELHHWVILVGTRVSIAKFDVHDGVSLLIPLTSDNHIYPCLLVLATPPTDLPL